MAETRVGVDTETAAPVTAVFKKSLLVDICDY
jgi:hypothetical protein